MINNNSLDFITLNYTIIHGLGLTWFFFDKYTNLRPYSIIAVIKTIELVIKVRNATILYVIVKVKAYTIY